MTSHPGAENITLLEGIRRYWVLIVGILAFTMGWSQINLRIEYQEARLTKLEQAQVIANGDLVELKNALIELKTILQERLPAPVR